MRGKIIEFDSDHKRGLIRGENGNDYRFIIDESDSLINPTVGFDVYFEPDGDKATDLFMKSNGDVEDIKATIYPTTNIGAKKSKNSVSAIMILGLVLGIGTMMVILILSEVEQRKLKELQESYHSQIISIEKNIVDGDCPAAASEYKQAEETRNEIYAQGTYYSLEPHAVQAHAIDIAECFAQRKEFKDALLMLDIKTVNNVDYLKRAAKIYDSAGESAKARQAESKAAKFDPNH